MVEQGINVCVDVRPGNDADIFRVGAADDILRLLVDAHDTEFTIPELADATEASRSTVWRGVTLLEQLGVIEVRKTPQKNYISIDATRLQKDDPILAIEQSQFHEPIRTIVEEIRTVVTETAELDSLVGIVVFGSVARGEADRQSDIDLFVVVEGNRTTARRRVADVVSDLRERRFDGDRFDFEPYVESVESARRAGSKLRDIFDEGVTVYGSERLQSLRKEVFADE